MERKTAMSGMNCLLVTLPVLVLAGCGELRPSYSMVLVSGTVTVDGERASNIVITFDSDSGPRAFGVTDNEGVFNLETKDYGAGAPEGSYKVWIQATKESKTPLPLSLTELPVDTVTVVPDKENLFEFDLTSRKRRGKTPPVPDNDGEA
jgi:hypothetical protein